MAEQNGSLRFRICQKAGKSYVKFDDQCADDQESGASSESEPLDLSLKKAEPQIMAIGLANEDQYSQVRNDSHHVLPVSASPICVPPINAVTQYRPILPATSNVDSIQKSTLSLNGK